MDENTTFNVKEVSKYIGVGVSSIRSLIYQRKIPYYKIGNKYFFRKNAIDTWIDNMEKINLNSLERGSVQNG